MRRCIRSLSIVGIAIAGVIALAWSSPMTLVAQLLATTALIMGGTQHPLSTAEPDDFVAGYLGNAVGIIGATDQAAVTYSPVAVVTPEEFWPTFGTLTFDQSVAAGKTNLDSCINGSADCVYNTQVGDAPGAGDDDLVVVYGYSQSAVIASLEKQALIDFYRENPEDAPDLSFVLVANPMKPNGGILERFAGLQIPILGVTFYGATPTDSGDLDFTTVDISRQYDGWSDFPLYPLNFVSSLNAVMGIVYLHPEYTADQVANAVVQGQTGDTTYYMIETDTLPLLIPLEQVGVPSPIIAVLDAPLRVIVEMGYDRDIEPGTATTARLIRFGNPLADTINLVVAIPTGLDDGIEEVTGTRPFGTEEAGMYGVDVGDDIVDGLKPDLPSHDPSHDELSVAAQVNEEDTEDDVAPAENDNTLVRGPWKKPSLDSGTESETPLLARRPLTNVIRGPIGSKPALPKIVRPTPGERPLQKAFNALTGLGPKQAPETGASPQQPKKFSLPKPPQKESADDAA